MKENSTMPETRAEYEIQLYSKLLACNLPLLVRDRYERKLNEALDKYYSK